MYPDDMHEYGPEQTYDVADMLKQYFRFVHCQENHIQVLE